MYMPNGIRRYFRLPRVFALAAALAGATPAFAAAAHAARLSPPSPAKAAVAPAADEERFERVSEALRVLMKEHGVPGAALGVYREGRSYTKAFGVTSLENPLTVTDETLFQIGSITKTFTGTLLMRLVEAGKVDLSSPVRRYLPDFGVADPDASARATVRDLVTHVGGWEGDLFDDTGNGDDALARIVREMNELEQQAPLGSAYSYNNAGFYAAARIIEVVTGKPYETTLEEQLLRPLQLD